MAMRIHKGSLTGIDDYLDEFATYCRSAGYSATTITARAKTTGRMLRALGGDPLSITQAQLVDWLGAPGWSIATRTTYRHALRSYFGFLHATQRRADDPAAGLRSIRRPVHTPKPCSDLELRVALERSNELWCRAITLAAFAGLRASEIAQLRRQDVTEETITVIGGKGGKDAVLPCHPRIWALLGDLPEGPIIRHPQTDLAVTGQWLSTRQVAHWRRIGLPQIHLHRFRHWYGTNLLRAKEHGGAGANLRVTQELLRHSSIASTAIYTQVTDSERSAAILALVAA